MAALEEFEGKQDADILSENRWLLTDPENNRVCVFRCTTEWTFMADTQESAIPWETSSMRFSGFIYHRYNTQVKSHGGKPRAVPQAGRTPGKLAVPVNACTPLRLRVSSVQVADCGVENVTGVCRSSLLKRAAFVVRQTLGRRVQEPSVFVGLVSNLAGAAAALLWYLLLNLWPICWFVMLC